MTKAKNKPAKATPPDKRKRWRRRIGWLLAALLLLLVGLRVTIVVGLRPVLQRVARQHDLDCGFERLDLHLLSGDVGIWHFRVSPAEGGESFFSAAYLRARISPLHLLRGKLVVRRVEAEGVDVLLERTADGSLPLLDRFARPAKEPPASSDKAVRPDRIRLSSPVKVSAFRLQKVRAHMRDHAVDPPLDTTVELDALVSDIGSYARPTRFFLDIQAAPLLDSVRIEGNVSASGNALSARASLRGKGLRPREAMPYLAPLGIHPVADEMDFRANATVALSSLPDGFGLGGTARLSDVTLAVDRREEIRLDRMLLTAERLAPGDMLIQRIAASGARCAIARIPDGFRIAGVELRRPAPASPVPAAANDPADAGTTSSTKSNKPRIRVNEVALDDIKAELRDETTSPHMRQSVEISHLDVTNIVLTPQEGGAKVELAGLVLAPGIADAVEFTGTAVPFAERKSFELSVSAEGVGLQAVEHRLKELGIESHLRQATFGCRIAATFQPGPEGALAADARVADLFLANGTERFALDDARISGVRLDPANHSIRVESIDLVGPRMSGRRESDGSLAGLGFRLKPASADNGASETQSPSLDDEAPSASPAPPRIEVARFNWSGVQIGFEDHSVSPPVIVNVSDAGIEATDLRFDPEAGFDNANPARIRAWLDIPEVIGSLSVQGVVAASAEGVSADLSTEGKQVTLAALAPYLKKAGLEPALSDGALRLRSRATVEKSADRLAASLVFEDMEFSDSGRELLGVDSVSIDELTMLPEEIAIGEVEIRRPRASVARQADGALVLGGIRITGDRAAQEEPAPPPAPRAIGARLNRLSVRDASLEWSDQAVAPSVATSLGLDLDLADLAIGPQAHPASIELVARASGALEELRVAGALALSDSSLETTLEILAHGMRAGPLAAYLPPGVVVDWENGQFSATVEADVGLHPESGHRAVLGLKDVSLRDGENPPLLVVDSFRLAASQIALPERIAIEEVFLAGLETDLQRSAAGEMGVHGLRFVKPAASQTSTEEAPGPTATPSTESAPLPLFTLETLDVNVRRIGFQDHARPGAAHMAIMDLAIRNPKPLALFGEDPTALDPLEVAVRSHIDPILESLELDLLANMADSDPSLELDLAVSGLSGVGLTEALPEIRDRMDGGDLADGRLRARLEAQLHLERQGLLDFDLSRGFSMELILSDFDFRNGEEGPTLAGVEDARVTGARIDPGNGVYRVRSVEVTKPVGRLTRDADGLHLLGFTLKPSSNGHLENDSEDQATLADPSPEHEPPAVGEPSPTTNELRIDTLFVSGLDFLFEDRSFDPALVVPLNELELEVHNLSTTPITQSRPLRWSAQIAAGDVDVPRRSQTGMVAGLLGDTTGVLRGRRTVEAQEMQRRPLFSQVAFSGMMSLHPRPDGWAKASVSALELAALRGVGREAGVTIGGGLFDYSGDLTLSESEGVHLDSRFTFVDLELSEPSGGPIVRYLRLPVPLDVAIAALRNRDGAIAFSLPVSVREERVSPPQVAAAVSRAFLGVLGRALAGAPPGLRPLTWARFKRASR